MIFNNLIININIYYLMAKPILLSSLIFIFIWILGAIFANRIAQKRADDPSLKRTYRMSVNIIYNSFYLFIIEGPLY